MQGIFSRVNLRIERSHAVRDVMRLFATKARELGVGTVLDIGANQGQFGTQLRKHGYTNRIVSFEPVSSAYAELCATARKNHKWDVAPRMALGGAEAYQEINVADSSACSSLLQVDERTVDVAPWAQMIGKEQVHVRRLDDVLAESWERPMAMKLDVQGSEAEVLRGAARSLSVTVLVMAEMSLTTLYRSGVSFEELFSLIKEAGFRCVGINHCFVDNKRNEVLSVDGIFVRDVA
jgi:FkbM family methyltransferase